MCKQKRKTKEKKEKWRKKQKAKRQQRPKKKTKQKARHGLKTQKGRNRHHLIPRSRHGNLSVRNLLLIYTEKHQYWHKLFGVLTLDEVIKLLTRVKSAKANQKGDGYGL